MDLSGKIVFKVKLDNEIKKLVIHNDDINYNEMLLMMQRIFSDKIKPHDEFVIKYTDEENDLITLSNDSDVSLALENSKILKLTIFLNDKEERVEEINPVDIVKELKHIRTSIDSFLDKFDTLLRNEKYKPRIEEMVKTTNDIKMATNNGNISSILNVHKEFDPLVKKIEANENQKTVNLPRRNSRAHSSDSVGSIELSPNPKKFDQFNNSQNVPQQQYANMNLTSLNGTHDKLQQQMHMPQPQPPTNTMVDQSGYYQQLQQQQQQQQHPHSFQSFNAQGAPQQQQLGQQVPPQSQQQQPQPNQTNQIQQPPLNQGQMQQPPQHQQQQQAPNQFYPNIPPNHPGKPNQPPNQMPYPGQMDQQQQQQQQQMYHNQPPNQQQQQQQPAPNWQQQPPQMHLQQGPPGQPQQPSPMMNQPPNSGFGIQGSNPYSKPNPILHRPPSANLYQQGYK